MTSKKALIVSDSGLLAQGVVMAVGTAAQMKTLVDGITTSTGVALDPMVTYVEVGTVRFQTVALLNPVKPGDEVELNGALFKKAD